MKNKHVIFHFLYYLLTIVVYMAFFYAASLMLDLTGKADNLGSVMAVTYGVLFVMTPVLVAMLMRFSLFKWYVDPIAAAEIPLFLYVGMLFNQAKRSGDLRSAFLLVNNDLGDDGGQYAAERGTMWIESGNKIYRLTPDLSQICLVETHFGEGKVLEITDAFKTNVNNAWHYAPYDY